MRVERALDARFHAAWFVLLLSALLIVLGIDPVAVVEYSIVFAVVTLPFTYFPMLVIAADKRVMKGYANRWLANGLGWLFLVLATVAALAAIPLMLMTRRPGVNHEAVDLTRDVLDHEIVDADGVPCGMVDDVELEGGPGSVLTVVALRIGPGAWTARLPWVLPRLLRALAGRRETRIPWSEVSLTGDRVKLKSSAQELGLVVRR